jgi:hypothetical protein
VIPAAASAHTERPAADLGTRAFEELTGVSSPTARIVVAGSHSSALGISNRTSQAGPTAPSIDTDVTR